VIPKLRGYRIRQKAVLLDNGAVTHELIQVPIADLNAWDATHDAVGYEITQGESNGYDGEEEYAATKEAKKTNVDNI